MTAPIVVTVPLEALEAAQVHPGCWHPPCPFFATHFVETEKAWEAAWYCDEHAPPGAVECHRPDHPRALNRALEWGQQMRAMKEGKP